MARIFRTVIRIITCIALIICPMPEKKCEAEFNGTFLQSWMSSSWDDGRWQEEIGAMKRGRDKIPHHSGCGAQGLRRHMDRLLQLRA